MSMILHCGGQAVSYDELTQIPLPEETSTYKPVAHYDLSQNVIKMGNDLLKNKEWDSAQYAVTKDGQRFFGLFTFRDTNEYTNEPMRFNIAVRNSYDKSMSVGMAMGATVFICDNLALQGDIKVMRKHTQNVHKDLEEMLVTGIYRGNNNYINILEDAHALSKVNVSNNHVYKFMGLLFGHGIIRPRQLSTAMKQWKTPTHETFKERNAWSAYNAINHALKSSSPNRIMEDHIDLHDKAMKYFA